MVGFVACYELDLLFTCRDKWTYKLNTYMAEIYTVENGTYYSKKTFEFNC